MEGRQTSEVLDPRWPKFCFFSHKKKRIEGKYDDGGEGKLVQEPESKVACTVLNANSLPEKHVRQLIK